MAGGGVTMSRSLLAQRSNASRFSALIAMNVVNCVDALLGMPEDQLGDERRDAERRQIGARGAAQIVEAPIGQPGTRASIASL